MADASLPLAGLVVLDLTRVLAGPCCTRLLADLGARVIKIERPRQGDDMRRAWLQIDEGREDQSTYFVRVNAGKESVSLDLAHPGARGVVLDLARAADVVVENFLTGVVRRLGCDCSPRSQAGRVRRLRALSRRRAHARGAPRPARLRAGARAGARGRRRDRGAVTGVLPSHTPCTRQQRQEERGPWPG